ncbi:MAG: phosphopentomutase [candidate division WOR-3 bacterium]
MGSSRVIIIVLDGVGCGALPDAGDFGDEGSNTLANTAQAVGGLRLPNLARLGLGSISPVRGVPTQTRPWAAFGKMAERSIGKDSTTGHWELAGVVLSRSFPVFPQGFPKELISRFEAAIGREVLGNVHASGTEIIRELGEEHMKTGRPIVYTSADSVFQIACHVDVVPLDELYRWCRIARELLVEPFHVARVIARPFAGWPGSFYRTPDRRDFSCPPPKPTLVDNVQGAGLPAIGIGKLDDLFAGRGWSETKHSVNNQECLNLLLETLERTGSGLIWTTLVQFDMDWGHRNDPECFARGLEEFDSRLPEVISRLRPDDLLFITADHGNDPTTPSTDHSREFVPLLVTGPKLRQGVNLGTRESFADLGQTAAQFLKVEPTSDGTSFLGQII